MLISDGSLVMTGIVMKRTDGANKTLVIETTSTTILVGTETHDTSQETLSFVTKKMLNGSC